MNAATLMVWWEGMMVELRGAAILGTISWFLLLTGCTGPSDHQPFAEDSGTGRCVDQDQDGFGAAGSIGCRETQEDCDDGDRTIRPGAVEVKGNRIDENCNGMDDDYDCEDWDRDGYGTAEHHDCPKSDLVDCKDGDPGINPGAREIPDDGKDNDCKGGDAPPPPCEDRDGDGYGVSGKTNCPGHEGQVDCNDDPTTGKQIHPGAEEIPGNSIDENCDGYKAPAAIICMDADRDGYGTDGKLACGPDGEERPADCNDKNKEVHPEAPETCNQRDDDCDGQTDECPDPEKQQCDPESKTCVSDFRGPCADHLDCQPELRCKNRVCLGFTGYECGDGSYCYSGFCEVESRECVEGLCEALRCEQTEHPRCSEDRGCYDCIDSTDEGGCGEGLCAGGMCVVEQVYYYTLHAAIDDPVNQLAHALIDCKRRNPDTRGPVICGGFLTLDLETEEPSIPADITEGQTEDWICDATETDFTGGAEDYNLARDIAGCGWLDADELRFRGPVRAGLYYEDCLWIDQDVVVGPCARYPVR